MAVRRTVFFITLFALLVVPIIIQKVIWLQGSEKTNGIMSFVGKRYSGQMVYTYSVVWFLAGRDTIWFNGKNYILFKEGEQVPVRYQISNPADARLNVFIAIWGDALIYGGLPFLILLVIAVHPEIVPYGSKIILSRHKPFVSAR